MEKIDHELPDIVIASDLQDGSVAAAREVERDRDISQTLRLPVRCLVDCTSTRQLLRPLEVHLVDDPEEHYDAIILRRPQDPDMLDKLLSRASNPAAVVIAFDASVGPRADAIITTTSSDRVIETLAKLEPLITRVSSLPRIPLGAERAGLLALALAYTRNTSIAPAWQPRKPELIGYPVLAGIARPRRTLEDLAETGLLRRRFFERIFVCEHCDSSRLHAREVCISCGSSHLSEHPIVHHYACGAQAPQPAFEAENGYRCPKCRKELRHYGVDYDKPGSVLVCGACSATMSEPDVSFACADCGRHSRADRAQRRDWFEYEITNDGIDAVRAGALPTAESAQNHRRGYTARDFVLIARQQLSLAARHNRPLSAWRMDIDLIDLADKAGQPASEQIRSLVIDIALSDVRDCDAFLVQPRGVVVCRPESTGKDVAAQIRQIEKRIKEQVRLPVRARFTVFEQTQVSQLLNDVR